MKLATAILVLLGSALATAQDAPPVQPLPAKKPATDAKVWGALIFATNDAKEAAAMEKVQSPAEFADIPQRLGKVFPYERFEVIGPVAERGNRGGKARRPGGDKGGPAKPKGHGRAVTRQGR
jgi:hypothetical protein